MSRCITLLVALAGCGRLSFDAVRGTTDAAGDGGAMIDGSDAPAACAVNWQQGTAHTELQLTASTEDPSVSADQHTIVFTSTAAGGVGGKDIYIAQRVTTGIPFDPPINLTALNSTVDDSSPELSPDGNTIYFSSDRGGSSDIWMSTRVADVWGAPTPVNELTTANAGELELAVSPDGLTSLVNRDAHMILYSRPSTSVAFAAPIERTELRVTTDIASPSLTSSAVYFHAGAVRDIYVACRNMDNTFQTPVPVTGINTTNRDADPFVLEGDAVMFYQCQQDICEAQAIP